MLELTATAVKVGTAYSAERSHHRSRRRLDPRRHAFRQDADDQGALFGRRRPAWRKGQKANDGVMAWIKNLVQTGGSNEKTPGATRSARGAEAPVALLLDRHTSHQRQHDLRRAKAPSCELRRAASPRAERVIVVDAATAERGEVEFAAGSEHRAWPAGVTLRPDGDYVVARAGRTGQRRQMTLRVLDSLPGEDDVLAELAARECKLSVRRLGAREDGGRQGKAS